VTVITGPESSRFLLLVSWLTPVPPDVPLFPSLHIILHVLSTMSAIRSQWFQPGEGIAREVITADIQRYLGQDALVKPGEHEVCSSTERAPPQLLTYNRVFKATG
jgi:hypothetical protein